VIVADTFGRPWRAGIVNVALGVAGLAPLVDHRGHPDDQGRVMHATVIAAADELASAAELVMGKTRRVPAAVVRGYTPEGAPGTGRDLIRPPEQDLFR
jgi:coenzyme F420-0:L-glutamate ligase / coenzyme F420-1:gamma-L-glutamate ligase